MEKRIIQETIKDPFSVCLIHTWREIVPEVLESLERKSQDVNLFCLQLRAISGNLKKWGLLKVYCNIQRNLRAWTSLGISKKKGMKWTQKTLLRKSWQTWRFKQYIIENKISFVFLFFYKSDDSINTNMENFYLYRKQIKLEFEVSLGHCFFNILH